MVKMQCDGITKEGERCQRWVTYNGWNIGEDGGLYCSSHRGTSLGHSPQNNPNFVVDEKSTIFESLLYIFIAFSLSFAAWFIIVSYNLFLEDDPEKHSIHDQECYQEYIIDWEERNGSPSQKYYERCLGENPHWEGYSDAIWELCCCSIIWFVFAPFTRL